LPGLRFGVRGRQRRSELVNVHACRTTTVVAKLDWKWDAVEGSARIVGLDDLADGFESVGLGEIFIRAGGTHMDLASGVDSTMAVERRAAVSIGPLRGHSNL
jgi:hypothetical protein